MGQLDVFLVCCLAFALVCGFRVGDLGFGVWGSSLGVQVLGFGVQELGVRV